MDIQSFAFGMLAALGLLSLVALVVGLFKVSKHEKTLKSLEEIIDNAERSLSERLDNETKEIHGRIDRAIDELLKRIEIGESDTINKLNRVIDRNENVLSNKITEVKTSLQELQKNVVQQINS